MWFIRPNIEKLEQRKDVRRMSRALKHNDASTRRAAAIALDRIGLPDDPGIRAWQATALGNWASAAAFGEVAVEPLEAAFRRCDPTFLAPVADAMVSIGGQAVTALCGHLGDRDAGMRHAAMSALVRIGEPSVKSVAYHLNDYRDSYVTGAAEVLAAIGGEQAIDALCSVLKGFNQRTIAVSARALVMIGEPAVAKVGSTVREMLRELRTPEAALAVAVLGEIRDVRAIAFMSDAFEDCSVPAGQKYYCGFRAAAVEALGKIGSAEAVPLLLTALDDVAEEEVVTPAAKILGDIGDPRAASHLCLRLPRLKIETKCIVRDALVRIGEPAVKPLLGLLRDDDWLNRQGVPEVLVKLGKVAVEDLCQMLADPSASVKRRAADILGNIGDESSIEALNAATQDRDKAVRKTAEKALKRMHVPRSSKG